MVALDSPYEETGTWLRGNVHAHTTNSDGARDPGALVADYADREYDFLALSDHDTFTDPAPLRGDDGPVLVPAVEVSADGPHVLHLGAERAVTPHEDRQRVVDAITDGGGTAVMAHPNWGRTFDHQPQSDLERIDGYAGLEVFNGVIDRLPGEARATDRWDRLLSAGRRVWGFATDDAHADRDVARGWTVVEAAERTPAAVLSALANGRFYASTGVTVTDVSVSGSTVAVRTAAADRVRLLSDHGQVQRVVEGPDATFALPDALQYGADHSYVRVECLGSGGETAWLQPVFLE